MTENKRFTLKHYEDTDWAYDNGKSIYTKEMVELLNEQEETIQSLKQELFEARKDYLMIHYILMKTLELRQEIFDDDKSNKNDDKPNKIFIQSYSIKPEYGGNFNL